MKIKLLFIFLIVALCGGHSFAGYIFYDNFDSENGGYGQTNYSGFTGWSVSDGTVDLLGWNGPGYGTAVYDYMPGNGLYVDMDGSSGNAGILSKTLSLSAGSYVLSFDLAGNNIDNAPYNYDPFKYGDGNDSVIVTTGSIVNTYTKYYDEGFTEIVQPFTVDTDGIYTISFEGVGGDNVGLLLDNVGLSLVPVPATILLGLLGLGVGGWKLRKSI
ncbi:MAG: hypothetical protein P8016_10080 [Sedimentisphaerales bacterium]